MAKINGAMVEATATGAKRIAAETAHTLLSGGRVAPLARDAGTHVRDRVREARKLATARLDLVVGYPGRKASEADRLAWYLDAIPEAGEASEATDTGEATPAE